MDLFLDFSYILPAFVFTFLAVAFAVAFLRKSDSHSSASVKQHDVPVEKTEKDTHNTPSSTHSEDKPSSGKNTIRAETPTDCDPSSDSGMKERETVTSNKEDSSDIFQKDAAYIKHPPSDSEPEDDDKLKPATQTTGESELDESASEPASPEEDPHKGVAGGEEVDASMRYVPGMLRTSQLEKMMTKEELEEEQRVQRQQLAAILQLLKDNQDTFGEVTEKDIEEQMKLYSI
ncbi:matrix-remodeling-associated protein 7 [Chanos chanos]|uniref:Matrix-remodeling-associated protein 7 n=1 Tax=Chanos chanos TaxID=29144 RepID=A0A6J2VFN9_CHACN|nr:uncharacterized protein LOC115813244 [Chanos chanos]